MVFGWSGSGKSTLIEALVASRKNLVAVRDDGNTDLISALEEAYEKKTNCEIVIEADSVLEPIAIAELFYLDGENGEPPDDRFEIRSLVTVIDVRSFLATLDDPKALVDFGLEFDEIDDRTSADVLIEQIEFSDVIVLNRSSDLDIALVEKTKSAIEWLNPRARLVEVPSDGFTREFLETFWSETAKNEFDFDDSAEGAGWIRVLGSSHPEIDRGFKISALALRARRPLHPIRFKAFLEELHRSHFLRIKGWVWIATRNAEMGLWSVAGRSSVLVAAGAWMAATPMGQWPEDPLERDEIMSKWVAPHGDRRQELAVIGFDLNELELRRAFKNCLLTDDEFALGSDVWSKWPDSLPDWSVDSGEDFDGLLQ